MPSNTELNSGSGGDVITTKERTHDGDATKSQAVTLAGVTGTEGSYTYEDINGSAANGLEVDVTRVQGTVTVDGSGVTQPVSASSLPLPSGAATSAAQLADGHGVIIDGSSIVHLEDVTHNSGDAGVMGLAVRNDELAPLAGTDGDYAPLQVDDLGALYSNQGNRISVLNSRAASTLAASATFQGVGEDVSKYGRVGVSIVSDNATDGVLTMEVSRDNITFGGPTRTWADTRFAQPHMWNIVEQYFRILYTNGTTEATNLEIQVQYSNNANTLLGHQLDETLLPETEAIISRSVIVGQDPNAVFVNGPASGVDNDNSSTTNLTAGTSLVFTGSFHDIEGYTGISVLIDGTSGVAVSGTLQMQFSHDGVTVHRDISVTTADVRNTLPRTLGVVAHFFRIIFTADADLTSFQAQTMIHTEQVSLVSRADGTLQGSEDVTNVRAVLVGATSQGAFVNVGVTNGGGMKTEADGTVAHNEADADSPLKIGGFASAGLPTAVDASDRVNASFDLQGQLRVTAETSDPLPVDLGANNDVSLNTGSNLVGDVGLGVRTSGGTSIFRSIDLDEGTLEIVKASPGQIYWLHIINLATSVRFVKIYNATSGTIGTGTPVLTFPIPTQGDSNGAGFTLSIPNGIAFSTGITIGASTGIADNDTGAPGANEIVVNLGFA